MLDYKYISSMHQDMIKGFDCSDEISVEVFLKEKALKLHYLRSAVTRLYFDENRNLVGYFTLYNDHVHVFSSQRTRHSWNLPSEIDLFPAVKIHYLGIDRRFRNQGYGRFLLTEAIYLIERIANTSGCMKIKLSHVRSSLLLESTLKEDF